MGVQQNLSQFGERVVVFAMFMLATLTCIYIGLNVWPGIYDHDSISYLANAMVSRGNLCTNHWESMAYSGLLCLTYHPDIFFGLMMLIQSLIGIGIFFFIVLSVYRKSLFVTILFVMMLLVWPTIWLSLFYLERDVLFALTAVIPVVMMLYLKKELWSIDDVLLSCVVLFICGNLRVEGYLFLLFFPLQLFLLKYIDLRFMLFLKLMLITIVSCILFFEIKKPESRKDHYSLNATLIFATDLYKNQLHLFSESEKQTFESVVDPVILMSTSSYYPHQAIRRESTHQSLYEFQRMMLLMLFKHPILFFEHRLKAVDHGKAQFISLIDEKKLKNSEAKDLLSAWQSVVHVWKQKRLFIESDFNIYKLYQSPKDFKYYWYFGHYGVPMIFLFFILIMIFVLKSKTLFIVAIPAFIHFFIVLLFSPAFHGKYLLFAFYFCILSLPFLYLEIKNFFEIK